MLFIGPIAFGIAMMFLCFIAINEIYDAFKAKGIKVCRPISLIFVLPMIIVALKSMPFCSRIIHSSYLPMIIAAFIYVCFLLTFGLSVFFNKKYSPADALASISGAAIISFLFVFLVMIVNMGSGKYDGISYLILLFLGAWGSDTFAYFVGSFFGRKKLCPDISPKKTVEGAIGGVVGGTILVAVYGQLFLPDITDHSLIKFILLGLTCTITAQLGDLIASVIKRYCGIKDYGRIMPGHGGVLDRFDSVLFLAPVVYLICAVI